MIEVADIERALSCVYLYIGLIFFARQNYSEWVFVFPYHCHLSNCI
jgi:hypothetical protein